MQRSKNAKSLGILWIKTWNPGFETVICYPCLTPSGNVTDRLHPKNAMGSSRNGPCPELNSIAGSSDWAAFTVGEQVILCAAAPYLSWSLPKKQTEIPQTLDFENPEMLKWMIFFLFWVGSCYFISLDDTKKKTSFLVSVRIECVLRSALDLKFQSHSHHLHERSTWKNMFDLNLTKQKMQVLFLISGTIVERSWKPSNNCWFKIRCISNIVSISSLQDQWPNPPTVMSNDS